MKNERKNKHMTLQDRIEIQEFTLRIYVYFSNVNSQSKFHSGKSSGSYIKTKKEVELNLGKTQIRKTQT